MAWNGAGNFQRTNGSFSGSDVWQDDANAGYDIVDARHDTHDQDLAQGINNCLTKDGQNSPTTNLSMNTYKHLNVGDGTARNQYATVGQLQDQGVQALSGVGGTANAITASMNPTISAYVTGAQYTFKAIATNSGATTLKIDSASAVAIQRNVAALVGGEIVNGRHYTVVYDGTVFQLLNTTANPLFLDSVNNRVGIGTTAPVSICEAATLNVGSGLSGHTVSLYSNDVSPVEINLRKSRGATVGTNTILNTSDFIGAIRFWGANGASYTQAALIAAAVDATPGATNDMPGALLFYTTPDASGSPVERMRINNAGCLGINTSSSSDTRVLINGVGTTGTTYSFTTRDSSSQATFYVRDDGLIYTGLSANSPYNRTTATPTNMTVGGDGILYRYTSSLRYKRDVKDNPHGLAEALQIRAVTYKGNSSIDGEIEFGGMIAEEIHDLGLNEFVAYNSEGEPDALYYGNMVSLAFKAIQELNAKVEALEARVQELEA